MAHDHGHVGRRELVEGEHPLLEYLAHLGVVLLAAAVLLRLAGVAVAQAHLEPAALDALSREPADAVLVGELVAVVGEGRAHLPVEHPLGHGLPDVADGPLHAAAVVRGDERAELEVGRQVVQRQHGLPVHAAPDHAVELGAGGPELSRQLLELVVAPLPGMGGRPAGRALLARLEPDLALELDVGQAAVAGLGPSVCGGPAHADLGAVEHRGLVGRQPARLGVPDGEQRDHGPWAAAGS